MLILRTKYFSNFGLIKRVTDKLDKWGLDYDVSKEDEIPNDTISINLDLGKLEVYIPVSFEYAVYPIEDTIQDFTGYYTKTKQDRNIFIISASGKITEDKYVKLVKFIIQNYDFCLILDKDV